MNVSAQSSARALTMPVVGGALVYALAAVAEFGALAQGQSGTPQLSFSPWTKFCADPDANTVCYTSKDGAVEPGKPVVSVTLIEKPYEHKNQLRVILPLGMWINPGIRMIVDDDGQPISAAYYTCSVSGCVADYVPVTGELIANLKKGRRLHVLGYDTLGKSVSYVLPLDDFAVAYEGPPTDARAFADRQRRFPEALRQLATQASAAQRPAESLDPFR